jgi:hypothetical protein
MEKKYHTVGVMKNTTLCRNESGKFGALKSDSIPVPSQGHYGFHSFPVVDRFCLFIYL